MALSRDFMESWSLGSEEILLIVKANLHADVLTVQLPSSLISCVSWGVKECRLIYKELSGRELGMHAG